MSLVVAHRGACYFAPENTLPAFEMAVEMGADGIETDVQLTSDAQLVMHHNYSLEGTTTASGKVCEHTLAELRKLDFGSHKGEEFAGTPICTFDECLEATRSLKLVNIELKAPVDRSIPYVRMVLDAIRDHDMVSQVVISAFDHSLLREVKELCPDLRCGALTFAVPAKGASGSVEDQGTFDEVGALKAAVECMPHDTPLSKIRIADLDLSEAARKLPAGVDIRAKNPEGVLGELLEAVAAIYPLYTMDEVMEAFNAQADLVSYMTNLGFYVDYVHPDFHSLYADTTIVSRLAAQEIGVSPYTPDDPADLKRLLDMGCYSIITNRPDLLLEIRDGGAKA